MTGGRTKVVVAMSGGVDSSVAACLLHEQGYDVTGLFMRTGTMTPASDSETRTGEVARHGCCSAADADDARAVAGMLNIPFFALDFTAQFDEIIEYFAAEYLRGRTPNPCILCNDRLKFGHLADYGRSAGARFIATGHYARIERRSEQYRLCRSVDSNKDQSYVLFAIGRDTLAKTLFPIGSMTKDEVREHARRFGLRICDKPESQDICFVPDRDYARLVRERHPEAFVDGPVVDATGRELGRHQGIANFTIGQRRGVNIAVGSPIYVTRLDAATNTVTVGPREELACDSFCASAVEWLVDVPTVPFRADVKIRYAHQAAPAVVHPVRPDRVEVRFDEPQSAATPGQAAVFYDGDVVLGGGWIEGQ